ncbi:MAG: AmmeMemoRadiSam system protein B, partial [Thermoguttaceae bacterium]
LEVTNLLVPGKNDSDDELKRMCAWFAETLGPDVPLHFTAFHPDFRMKDVPPTPPATLVKAHDIARLAGLHYVYTGNVCDRARQSTYCPHCGQVLVGRDGYRLSAYAMQQDRCRGCGTAIAGRFGNGPGDWGSRRLPIRISDYAAKPDIENSALSLDQDRLIFQATGRRLIAAVLGQIPDPLERSLAGLAQMAVVGAFVTLRRAGALRSCCGSLGHAVPLCLAIEHAAVAAAKEDRRFPPISPAELPDLDMDVWLLSKLEPVLAEGSARRNAVIIGKHGLKIAQGARQGLLLPGVAVEHHLDAQGFLEQVCRKAGLPADAWQDEDTVLMTFEGHAIEGEVKTLLPTRAWGWMSSLAVVSTADRIAVASDPQSRAGSDIRLPAVAGLFYPRHAEDIDRTLDEWFAHKPEPEPWAAVMVPHAGWVYSGRLAADVFSRVRFPKQVIVLAPRHHPEGAEWAVAPHRTWQLPGCCLDSDPELARMLADSIRGLELDAAAHVREHAIEVQLPLVARLSPHSRVVGITIHVGKMEDLQRFGEEMAGVLAGLSERPLLVISSDMNHFADDGETRRRDRMALEALASLDPERLYRTVYDNRISMCGVLPAVVVLNTLRCLHALNRCHEVGYTTSAAASHDAQRCVGYAGMLFA